MDLHAPGPEDSASQLPRKVHRLLPGLVPVLSATCGLVWFAAVAGKLSDPSEFHGLLGDGLGRIGLRYLLSPISHVIVFLEGAILASCILCARELRFHRAASALCLLMVTGRAAMAAGAPDPATPCGCGFSSLVGLSPPWWLIGPLVLALHLAASAILHRCREGTPATNNPHDRDPDVTACTPEPATSFHAGAPAAGGVQCR